VKHAEVLGRLAARGETCILLYIIPRMDCQDGVEINEKDPVYYSAVQTAVRRGVVLRAFSLDFRLDGTIWSGGEVPFYIRF
jgi:DNA-binding sugar fermentation-stimulating protein